MYVNILYYGRPVWRTVTICHTFYKHICSDSNVFCQYYPDGCQVHDQYVVYVPIPNLVLGRVDNGDTK